MGQNKRYVITTPVLLVVAFLFIAPIPALRHNVKQAGLRKQNKAALAPTYAELEELSREIEKTEMGSNIPLDLVTNNECVPLYVAEGDPGAGNDPTFTTNTKVVADANGHIPAPGTAVCTRNGKSAVIDSQMMLTSIQATSLEDLEEYQEQFDLLTEFRNQRNKPVDNVNSHIIN